MNPPSPSLVPFVLCGLLSGAAQAQSYDFTGTVKEASGIYSSIPIGATVTGTYTFELSNANPAQSNGTIGSFSTTWDAELFGGSYYVTSPPPVSSVVFSSTANVDGFTYASYAPTTFQTFTRVMNTVPPPNGTYYEADEFICVSLAECHSSDLFGNDFSGIDYTSAGLPLFSASPEGWNGQFATGPQDTGSTLEFSITSLRPATAAPESSSVALMLIGLAALGFNLGRPRRNAGQ